MATALLIGLVILVVCIVVVAFILQLATKMVAGFKPGLGLAVVVVIVSGIAGAVASWVLKAALGGTGSMLGIVAAFLINAFIINAMVKAPAGPMGFGKACLVSLIEYIVEIVLAVVIAFLVGGAVMSLISGAATATG